MAYHPNQPQPHFSDTDDTSLLQSPTGKDHWLNSRQQGGYAASIESLRRNINVAGDQGDNDNDNNAGDWQKAEIVSHPLYEQLLTAHVACLRIATPVDQLPRIDAQLAQSQQVLSKYLGLIDHDHDKELDHFMTHYVLLLCSFKQQLQQHVRVHAMEAVMACWEIEQSLQSLTGVSPGEGTGATMSDHDHDDEDQDASMFDGQDPMGFGPLVPTETERSLMDRVRQELKHDLKQGYKDKIVDIREEILRKRRAGKLPGDTTSVLKAWWQSHAKWPYPTEEDKARLVEETGLQLKQINNWFINQRKRNWHTNPSSSTVLKTKRKRTMDSKNMKMLNDLGNADEKSILFVRVIRKWINHVLDKPLAVLSLDLILQDQEGNKAHASILKKFKNKYENKIDKYSCYQITKASYGSYSGNFKFVDNSNKVNISEKSEMRLCDDFGGSIHGFKFTTIDTLLSGTIPVNTCIDNGTISNITKRNGIPAKKLEIDLHGSTGNKIPMTLWDSYATQILSYIEDNKNNAPMVVILQFVVYRPYRDDPGISNSISITKIFINEDIQEIMDFKNSLIEMTGSESSSSSTLLASPAIKIPFFDEFVNEQNSHVS